MDTTSVGFIGLGKMGTPMVKNLVKAGVAVKIYNRTPLKEEALKSLGVTAENSPAALLQQVPAVIVMVSDDQAIRDLFTGANGLLSANTTGRLIINMSTVSPAVSKEMAALLKEQGNEYLDAPVSGSVKQAEEAQLVIMAGGEAKTFEQAKPILNYLGKLTLHVGAYGAGNTAKLAINTLLSFHTQGLAEAVVFAQQHGIETQDLLTLINNSALGNVLTKIKGDAILQDNYNAAFALKHLAKDLRLAKNEGLDSPLGNVVAATFQQAESAFGEEDVIAIIKQVKK